MWVWQCPDGEFLGDDEGNFMYIFGTRENAHIIVPKLAAAAKFYGYPEGKAVFWSGKRPITDEELEEQITREKLGLVPDPLDMGALMDEARARKNDR